MKHVVQQAQDSAHSPQVKDIQPSAAVDASPEDSNDECLNKYETLVQLVFGHSTANATQASLVEPVPLCDDDDTVSCCSSCDAAGSSVVSDYSMIQPATPCRSQDGSVHQCDSDDDDTTSCTSSSSSTSASSQPAVLLQLTVSCDDCSSAARVEQLEQQVRKLQAQELTHRLVYAVQCKEVDSLRQIAADNMNQIMGMTWEKREMKKHTIPALHDKIRYLEEANDLLTAKLMTAELVQQH